MQSINFSSAKTAHQASIFCLAILLPFLVFSQTPKYFGGTINYGITYHGKGASGLMMNGPPTAMDLHIYKDNYIINLKGAPGDTIRVPRTFLFIGDSNHTYIVNMESQTYYLRDYYQGDTLKTPPRAQRGKDTTMIHGIMCRKYRVVKPDAITFYWVSDDYRVDPKWYEGKDAHADFMIDGLDGRIPIRKVIKKDGITVTAEARKITVVQHAEFMFRIPRGFKRKKRDPRK